MVDIPEITLIAPPWPLFNRPSIQLASLKVFLKKARPDTGVRIFHPYLKLAAEMDFDRYYSISQSTWAAESVGAGILFPERQEHCNRLFLRALRAKATGRSADRVRPEEVRQAMSDCIFSFVSAYPWKRSRLVGISVCLNQFTAGILIAREIKRAAPGVSVVLGGTSCAGELGLSILAAFPFVDFVVNGEGELPLLGLYRYLRGETEAPPPGVHYRATGAEPAPCQDRPCSNRVQVKNMDELPVPDFDDYYRELGDLPRNKHFFPVLPVEFSRGCWWNRCRFCNLNLQWQGYRFKSAAKMAGEIDGLARRYGALDFAFMDNVLPRRQAGALFEHMVKQGRDYNFFAELRAAYSAEDLSAMFRGGLRDIQVGIEALSTSLLRRLGKGVRAIDNVAVMRNAEESGLRLSGNLIMHFPGSTEAEVEETENVLDFVWPYRPLKAVSFWLGFGSPVAMEPGLYGLYAVKAHPFFIEMFPQRIRSNLASMFLTYRGDRGRQYRLWKEVEKKVAAWDGERKNLDGHTQLLSYRDGGDYLIIRQITPGGKVMNHRLTGLSRQLYLRCSEMRSMTYLFEKAAGQSREQVAGFVSGMVRKRLMFQEDDMVIGLAVHAREYT
ncbi:MAG TPA: RiPP maturation radical SAM protein 1 [Thermodesulfobacteriaceae bacterium]|nr:RiPP maturation radical SAM protein 1 [Thermodesulfobacteriaceae bacterium]